MESASIKEGDFDYLLELAKTPSAAGATYFTAQILDPSSFVTKLTPAYQVVKDVAFDHNRWCTFFDECRDLNINFIPCPADQPSLDFCVTRLQFD